MFNFCQTIPPRYISRRLSAIHAYTLSPELRDRKDTSVGSILLLAWLFRLDAASAVSLLPKSVTTAIGVDVSTELGGIPALTTAVIILTGIIGNLLAVSLCKLLRITNPIARGIAIGTSSHAIGTSKALEIGQVEGAMSSLSIAVAGILTAILCPAAVNLLPM